MTHWSDGRLSIMTADRERRVRDLVARIDIVKLLDVDCRTHSTW